MNSIRTAFTYLALAGTSAFAQLAVLPPPSMVDGNPISSIGLNAGPTHWDDPTTLGRYHLASDATLPLPGGLTWANTAPAALTASRTQIGQEGGTIRAIFAGETAGWLNDFGYTYSGQPGDAESFTVFSDIQAPSSVQFGDHVNIALLPGEADSFDFWFNATDSFTADNPPPPTSNGGVYTVFDQTNSRPYFAPGNVRFAQSPLMVSTWMPALGRYEDVATYLVTIEDWRSDRGADRDTSDFIFGLQFFNVRGIPLGDVPVPEPSTYGMIGAVSLLGLAAWRRRKSAPQVATK